VQSDALTLSATTGTAAIGETATVAVSLSFLDTDATSESATATAAVLSSPVTSTVVPTFSITAEQTSANTAGSTIASAQVMTVGSPAAGGRASGSATLSLVNLAVAGTYVIRVTPAGGLATTAQTWTVTVAAKPLATLAASTAHKGYSYYSGSDASKGGNWTGLPDATSDALTLNGYATPSANLFVIKVVQSNGSTTNPLVAADAVPLTATVTGASAVVSITGENTGFEVNAARGTYAITTTAQLATLGLTQYVYVWATGTPGVATVTIKMGDVTFPAKSFNIYEAAKTYTAAAGTGFTGTAFPVGASAAAINVTAKDPSGLLVPGATVYAFSSDATIATVSASAVGTTSAVSAFTLTGVKAGSTTITFGNASTVALSTVTTTMPVSVTGSTATTVTLTLDKADYVPGEKVTLTITAKDADSKSVADGARALLATITSNVALGGTALSTTTTLLGGVATQTFFAPATPGSFTISATEGAATASTTKAILTVTATVTNAGADVAQAAADAATDAYDAALAATDAANDATAAAEAATAAAEDAADAVAALATQVTEMVNALKKQITALTNLVIKIQKKVKA
jgi:hypothetical protein